MNLGEDIAYRSMYYYLQNYYQLTGSDEIGGMLGYMAILEDGSPADPAVREDWAKAVARARQDTESVKFKLTRSQDGSKPDFLE